MSEDTLHHVIRWNVAECNGVETAENFNLTAYRPAPPPPLPPFAEVLGAASTQPTTLPSTRYTSTRFPNPQGRLP
jgi:hypothetical protein